MQMFSKLHGLILTVGVEKNWKQNLITWNFRDTLIPRISRFKKIA